MHWMSRRRSNTMEVSFIDQDLLWGALQFIFPGLTISWGPTPQYLFTLFKLICISIILTFFLPWNLPRESQSSPYSWRQSYFIFDVVIIWSCAVVLQSWLCPNCIHNYNLYLEFCIFCGKKMRTGKIVNMTTLGLQKEISTLINRTNILFWAGRV